MSDYRHVTCPHCGALHNSSYRADLSSENVNSTRCLKCHKPFKVIYGKGKVKATK